MTLATLLGGNKAADTELDALFTAKPVASKPVTQIPPPAPTPGSSKQTSQKRKSTSELVATPEPKKRVKTTPSKTKISAQVPKNRTKAKGKAREVEPAEEDEDENSDLEKTYLDAHKHPRDMESDDSDDGEADKPIEHETVTKAKMAARSTPKVKYVPADETPEIRDQRTIFLGNISVEVAQKKSLLKQLHRHILSRVPTAKIESTRFRSVPFQAPTSTLPADDDDAIKGKADPKNALPAATKTARQHDLDRASTWRSSQPDKNEQEPRDDEKKKTFLTPNQKKKIAFIKHEFHAEADTVNAYIVFAYPVPAAQRPSNLPPLPPVLDPLEAARQAVRVCDGTTFMGRVIRVDSVRKKGVPGTRGEPAADLDADSGVVVADPKSTVFVGNLDFASKEEDLRVFFEGVVAAVRGPPPAHAEDGAGAEKRNPSWVVRVRIVRDRDTQLGKGFAYVQFIDHECVDEVLALEPSQVKFAKRKLRVQRCRTLPGSSASTRQATASKPSVPAAADTAAVKRPAPIVVPKGDPALGEKLAHLSKDARKQYKSGDADRVARRLAKKKSRMAMAVAGGKIQGKGKERARERVRKNAGETGKKTVNKGTKKRRVRSERSLTKRNGKKAAGISE